MMIFFLFCIRRDFIKKRAPGKIPTHRRSLFAESSTLSVSGIQYSFADTKAFGSYFQKLILIDEFDGLLQT